MPQTYRFTVSMPVNTLLPRDRMTNTVHLEHGVGSLLPTDLESMCSDIVAMYKTKYFNATKEIVCTAYDVDAVPNYPRARVSTNVGNVWDVNDPREVALCLSFAGENRGNKNERGRIFLIPQLNTSANVHSLRPNSTLLNWALGFYTIANESFPDLGGVDWKFGVWSRTLQKFTQTKQAWVNDEWDTQRKRGLRESTRVSANREG